MKYILEGSITIWIYWDALFVFKKLMKIFGLRILKWSGVFIREITDVNMPEYHHFIIGSFEYLDIFFCWKDKTEQVWVVLILRPLD